MPCAACDPADSVSRGACGVCGGFGSVPRADPRELLDAPEEAWPAWALRVRGVIVARARIAAHGVEGWMRLEGVTPDPLLGEALGVMDAELERLQHAARAKRAAEAREKRLAAERSRKG